MFETSIKDQNTVEIEVIVSSSGVNFVEAN